MIIDSHAHVMLPVERQLALMREGGIQQTVLFATSVHPEKAADLASFQEEYDRLLRNLAGVNPVQEQISRCTRANRELVAVIRDHPDQFRGFGLIPAGLPGEETARWIETQIIPAGLCGLGEFSIQSGKMSDLEAVFAAAADFGNLPLWVHTFHPCALPDIQTLLQLARRYSGVPLIVGHMGGYYWLETIKAAREIPNVFLDVSAAFTVFAPRFAVAELPERTLFGSDAPYGDPLLVRRLIERIAPDHSVAALVLGENIGRILKI